MVTQGWGVSMDTWRQAAVVHLWIVHLPSFEQQLLQSLCSAACAALQAAASDRSGTALARYFRCVGGLKCVTGPC